MKALTVMQPWATLVALGAKRIETRSWSTSYRGPLAIHASSRISREAAVICREPPFREALAAGGYGEESGSAINPFGLPLITRAHAPAEQERSFGDYTPGRFAWLLDQVRRLPEPVAAKGALGLWEWVAGVVG